MSEKNKIPSLKCAIFKQLLKEFWFLFVAALGWCAYNFSDSKANPWSIASLITLFSSAFFLVSWLLSQYFRVRKQAKVENDLQTIDKGVKGATTELINYQTGGNSFCYLVNASISDLSNTGIETVIHQGNYPLFDLSARVHDLDYLNSLEKSGGISFESLTKDFRWYGGLIPGHVTTKNTAWNLGDKEQKRYNIFWTARNGNFIQLLRLKKIEGRWQQAVRVIRDNITIFENVSEGYPRNDQGEVIWDEAVVQ